MNLAVSKKKELLFFDDCPAQVERQARYKWKGLCAKIQLTASLVTLLPGIFELSRNIKSLAGYACLGA